MVLNKSEICKFDLKKANNIILKLEKIFDKNIVIRWSKSLERIIDQTFKKYKVVEYKVNKNSYMGIVIDCKSLTHGMIFIKVVPPMLNRFKYEVGTLTRLPSNKVVKIYEIDTKNNLFVMEKILPGTLVDFDGNEEIINELFNELSKNKIEIDKHINENFKSFDQIVERDYNQLIEKHGKIDEIEIIYNNFKRIYPKISKGKNFLLHGDIYKNNMLFFNEKVKIIDPLGFKAPFVMELVSICAYSMFYSKENNFEVLEKFANFFKKYSNKQDYSNALYCQLVKVLIPSVYEANDGGTRAKRWWDIINEIYTKEGILK